MTIGKSIDLNLKNTKGFIEETNNDLKREVFITDDDQNDNDSIDSNNQTINLEEYDLDDYLKKKEREDMLKRKFARLTEIQKVLVNKVKNSYRDIAKDEWLNNANTQSSIKEHKILEKH